MMASTSKYEILSPSGVCRMGETDVNYYKRGNRLWFDRKHIEKVLTGRNQHNILGQYKDPKNHAQIFDDVSNKTIYIISKTGVYNYLQKAWSVKEENRYAFYAGVKEIENPAEAKVTEPLQMPIKLPEKEAESYVTIKKIGESFEIFSNFSGENVKDRNMNIVSFLLSAVHEIIAENNRITAADTKTA